MIRHIPFPGLRPRLLAWLLSSLVGSSLADPGALAIIYPDVGPPYQAIYEQMMAGIASQVPTPPLRLAVGPHSNETTVNDALKKQHVTTVIALGHRSLDLTLRLDRNIRVIAGGVVRLPDHYTRATATLSLAPDPAQVLAQLRSLQPRVQRVTVIYNPKQSDWLVRLAQEAAPETGLVVVGHPAPDRRTALQLYQAFFREANSQQDALWLLQDSGTVDDDVILPFVLEAAWTQRIAVLSSTAVHARRGTLFAVYPNSQAVGQALARMALAPPTTNTPALQPMRPVELALNRRTAQHLGIRLTAAQERTAGQLWPSN